MAEEKNKNGNVSDETTVSDDISADGNENENENLNEGIHNDKPELETAKEQITALTDKMMRTAAEFDNFKKRTSREKEDIYKTAVCETVLALLPVLDNLDRAVKAAESTAGDSSVLDGIKMVKKQFDTALTSIGVSEIVAVDCEFDPEKHNAVMTEESDKPENTVIDELQKGYIYKDKVIRHSMVKVSN